MVIDTFTGTGATVIFAVGAVLCLLAAASGKKVKFAGAELSAGSKTDRLLLALVGVALVGAVFLALVLK